MCNRIQRLAGEWHYLSFMRKILQTLAFTMVLFASASAADAQVTFGVQVGQPPAPRAYAVPRQPASDYMWIEGYWYPQAGKGSHYAWHNGYWTRPPYQGAYWVEPYYIRGNYYEGRWENGQHGYGHNHGWDKSKQRDERRGPPPNDHNQNQR